MYFCLNIISIIAVEMLRAYKYRLYPNREQAGLIDKHIGSARFIYNLALETKNYAYASSRKNLTCFDLNSQLPELKKECPWLKEIDSQALQQSIVNLDKAFTQFFKGAASFPNFKKKHKGSQSFRHPHGSHIKIENGKLYQPKFKEGIKVIIDREIKGKIKNTTISRTPTGKYFVSILIDTEKEFPKKKKIKESTAIGIDLGLKSFIVTSDGRKIDNPKYLRNSIARLRILQKRASRKVKGSNNRKKANFRVAKLHEKITNQRKDFLHKLSTELINNHDTLCMEDLNISGLLKNHCLAQSIADAGWSMFAGMAKYKSDWYGKNVLQIPTFEPSTKLCSCCGAINHALTLADREWLCANCNTLHDRDENAAKNIKNYCFKDTPKGIRVEPVELPTMVGALKQEKLLV